VNRPRRLVWNPPETSQRRRSLRDYAIVYAGLALVVVVFGIASGNAVGRTVVIAVFVFVVAIAWTGWWLRRTRPKDGQQP
jgi:Flp pilus assembly protein TadB